MTTTDTRSGAAGRYADWIRESEDIESTTTTTKVSSVHGSQIHKQHEQVQAQVQEAHEQEQHQQQPVPAAQTQSRQSHLHDSRSNCNKSSKSKSKRTSGKSSSDCLNKTLVSQSLHHSSHPSAYQYHQYRQQQQQQQPFYYYPPQQQQQQQPSSLYQAPYTVTLFDNPSYYPQAETSQFYQAARSSSVIYPSAPPPPTLQQSAVSAPTPAPSIISRKQPSAIEYYQTQAPSAPAPAPVYNGPTGWNYQQQQQAGQLAPISELSEQQYAYQYQLQQQQQQQQQLQQQQAFYTIPADYQLDTQPQSAAEVKTTYHIYRTDWLCTDEKEKKSKKKNKK